MDDQECNRLVSENAVLRLRERELELEILGAANELRKAGIPSWSGDAIDSREDWSLGEQVRVLRRLYERVTKEKDDLESVVKDLAVYKARLDWLHVGSGKDPEGYEWGVARIKHDVNGQVSSSLWTFSDHSDLDAEMAREAYALASGTDTAKFYCRDFSANPLTAPEIIKLTEAYEEGVKEFRELLQEVITITKLPPPKDGTLYRV